MTGSKTLIDLQSRIFQDVPSILTELDEEQARGGLATIKLDSQDHANLNFVGSAKFGADRDRRRSFGRGRGGKFNNRGFDSKFKSSTSGTGAGKAFCRLCKVAGSNPSVYNSHEIGNCKMFTKADLESIAKLNSMEEENMEEEDSRPNPFYEPGWDDEYEDGEEKTS